MKIRFTKRFSTDRDIYAEGGEHDVPDVQAEELVRKGIATVVPAEPPLPPRKAAAELAAPATPLPPIQHTAHGAQRRKGNAR